MSDVVALGSPAAMEAMASLVDRDHDFRVLRRMPPMRRNVVRGVRTGMLAGCAVHVETTGGRLADDAIIELALQRFWADADGRIVMTGRPHHWLEDPGRPLPPEVTRMTGLADPDLVGRSIMDPVAASLIADADFVVASDASFDRPFIERRLPLVAGRPWVCTTCDVEWKANGFTIGGLPHLLTQIGLFYDPHRASTEVTALLHLLDHPLPFGGTVLKAAVEAAARPTWAIDAVGAPSGTADLLEGRGYLWNPVGRHWSKEVSAAAFDDEYEWIVVRVYGGTAKPRFRSMTWCERHAADG
ncbi:3'-5' exonuclease [Sphingomonas sp. 4RDLI-65]|uniref:3'-5' exonuclease n=1 Tax=Sphingomonas sp. 4RDLI-65 TaxID=3111641 RepID=UPI003C1654B2